MMQLQLLKQMLLVVIGLYLLVHNSRIQGIAVKFTGMRRQHVVSSGLPQNLVPLAHDVFFFIQVGFQILTVASAMDRKPILLRLELFVA
jgi:hypothetical protein